MSILILCSWHVVPFFHRMPAGCQLAQIPAQFIFLIIYIPKLVENVCMATTR